MRFLAIFLLALIPLPLHVFAAEMATTAKQALVMDYETGQVLLSKKADQHMPTSSMSKVMTSYMVFDALKKGDIKMDSTFRVSEKAWRKGGSKMFVEQGKKIKIKDLLRGVIVQSGNDATIVLAEGLAGDEDKFAKLMTEKAMEIGMENSNFVNASGWPDPKHYSTAEDLALMTRRVIEDFPEYYKLFSEKEFTYNNIKQQNRNPLLYRNIGADGLKTGHTEIAGYGLIGTAVQDDRRVIMVVNGLENEKARANESVRLIEWGLNNFINKTLVKKDQVLTEAPVVMGQGDVVPLTIEKDIKLTIPKAVRDKFIVDVNYKSPLVAPIQKGDEIGALTINIPDMSPVSYPVFAATSIEEVGFFSKTWMKMKNYIFGAF